MVQDLDEQQESSHVHAAVSVGGLDNPSSLSPSGSGQQHGWDRPNKSSEGGPSTEGMSAEGDAGDAHLSSGRSDRSGPSGSGSGSGSGFGSKSNTSLELTPASSLASDEFFPLTVQNVAIANTSNLRTALYNQPDVLPTLPALEKAARKLRVTEPSPTRIARPEPTSRPSFTFNSSSAKNQMALDSIVSGAPFRLPSSVPTKQARSSRPPPAPSASAHPAARPPGSPTHSGTSGWSGSSAKAAEAKDILSPLPTSTLGGPTSRPNRPQLGRLASVPTAPTIQEGEVASPASQPDFTQPLVQTPGLSTLLQSPFGLDDDDAKSRSTASEASQRTSKRRPLANSPFRSFHGQLPNATVATHSPSIFPTIQTTSDDRRGHRRVTSTDQESLLSAGRVPQVDSPDIQFRQPFFHNFQPLTVPAEPAAVTETSPNCSESGSVRSAHSAGSVAPRIRNTGNILAPHGSFSTVKGRRTSYRDSASRRAQSESSGGSSLYDTPRNGSIRSFRAPDADANDVKDLAAIAAAAGDQIALEEIKRERAQTEGASLYRKNSNSITSVTSWGLSGTRSSIRRASQDSNKSHPLSVLPDGSSPGGTSEPSVGAEPPNPDVGTTTRGAVRLGLGITTPRMRQPSTSTSDLFMDAAMLASRQSALDSATANRVERQRRESDGLPSPTLSRRPTTQSRPSHATESSSRHPDETDEERRERHRRRRERKERKERRDRRAAAQAEQSNRQGVLKWAGTVQSQDRTVQPPVHYPYPPASLDDSVESVEEVEREEQQRRDDKKARRRSGAPT